MRAVEIPLSRYADELLVKLARATASTAIASIDGQTLLGERAMLAGSSVPDRISAGGGCRLFSAMNGSIALNLSRADDRELLPALFSTDELEPNDNQGIAEYIAHCDATQLVSRGRSMGLAIAAEDETIAPPIAPCTELVRGARAHTHSRTAPRVVDLSALWAGPLATHLISLAGAEVIKVESLTRPDAMRKTPDFFALLNQDKASVVFDFKSAADLAALQELILSADIVVEAARPRALAQLGIDAADIVRKSPGLIWLTITAHGATGEAANWVGFGDDCGVAGGLGALMRTACGETGFVGDAIADPLTGIFAALTAWNAWVSHEGGRFGIAMSHVVANALSESLHDRSAVEKSLRNWRASVGQPFPEVQRRPIGTHARFGEHTHAYRRGHS
jgi:CoA-transferase family III